MKIIFFLCIIGCFCRVYFRVRTIGLNGSTKDMKEEDGIVVFDIRDLQPGDLIFMNYIPKGFKFIKDLRYIFYSEMPKPQYSIVFPYTKYPGSEYMIIGGYEYNYIFEKPNDKNANYLAMAYYLSNTHFSTQEIKNKGIQRNSYPDTKTDINTDMNNDTNTDINSDTNSDINNDTNTDINTDMNNSTKNETNTNINTGRKSESDSDEITDGNEDKIAGKIIDKNNSNYTLVIIIIPSIAGVITIIIGIILYICRNKIRWPCQRNNIQNNIYYNNNNQENICGSTYNIYSENINSEENKYPEIPLGLRDTNIGINNLVNNIDNEPMICYPPINDSESDNSSYNQNPTN